jgi:hypothetical protein
MAPEGFAADRDAGVQQNRPGLVGAGGGLQGIGQSNAAGRRVADGEGPP